MPIAMTKSRAYLILFSLMLVNLLGTSGLALPFPILAPLFLGESGSALAEFGGWPKELLLALVLAIYPLGMLLGGSFIGALSDLHGRKPVLLISLALSVLGYLLSGWAIAIEHYPLFLLARFATGICEGNIAISRAIAADLHPVIDKTRAFSWLYAMMYGGWLLGPLAGGYLMLISAQTAFYAAAIALMLTVLLVWIAIEESHAQASGYNKGLLKAISEHNSFTLLKLPAIKPLFLAYLLLTLGLNGFYEFFAPYLVVDHDYDSIGIGHMTAVQTLAMVLVSALVVERLAKRFSSLSIISVALLGLAVSLLLAPWLSPDVIPSYFFITGALIATYNGLLPVYVSDRFSELGQGKLMGLLTSTFFLANVLIALIGGAVALFGPSWSIFISGLMVLSGRFLLLRYFKQSSKAAHAPQPATLSSD
ncbi:MFS transporter [Aliiglaciecola sp. CAU 1673]|uniref:MFS transporter n=1 Tax=Aliiglaciecola sp. CAU 1673 TaxID=3032595 RepID=UPI0023DA43AD|nr:MFS transporter [Aliiglaciecola sp. CAU 1673]MDF2177086.1 MFS transporter [Aliiglaciecola sp. CAU 1673]